jgi:mono/diheme cytochrome c family protein
VSRGKVVLVALAALAVAEAILLTALVTRQRWQKRAADTPVTRGEAIAIKSGCFGCHGPGGSRPIKNPGSKSGDVPGWPGGTWMMWNNSEEDVRAWIVDGHPKDREPDQNALMKMPAYGKWLTKEEVDDLVAYVLAVSMFGWPEDPKVADGREAGVKLGCFGCHGPEGRGLVQNPGSFKGYIPPWDGPDYLELVRDDDEFRQWVRNGISDRFRDNPPAKFFLDRQPIPMPAYGDRVSEEEMEALLAYVGWVRGNPRGKS